MRFRTKGKQGFFGLKRFVCKARGRNSLFRNKKKYIDEKAEGFNP
ncbi:ABC transporter substrate-binding protein [Listeria monocytogenes]|nr:ABC transporter substrate-binding protein [Listeria monocytogenes]